MIKPQNMAFCILSVVEITYFSCCMTSMIKNIFFLSLIVCMFINAGETPFSGTITFKYITNKDTSLNMYHVSEPMVKLDQFIKHSKAVEGSYIFDLKNNTAKFISPRRKMYGDHKVARIPDSRGTFNVTNEGGKYMVAGLACSKYIVRNSEQNTEITFYIHMGAFTFFTPLLKLWSRKDLQSVYFLKIAGLPQGAMPMKSEERYIHNNALVTTLEVTSIVNKTVPSETFRIPPSFTKFE